MRRWYQGLWNYDLRRTLACYLSDELHYDDVTIWAVLNHSDGSGLSHYCFKSFDSLAKPIQEYAAWLWRLRQNLLERQRLSSLSPDTDTKIGRNDSKPHPRDA